MQSKDYWEARANERMAEVHKSSNKTIYKINAAYDKAIKDINADIENIVYNFIKDKDMPIDEVNKLLNERIPNSTLDKIREILPSIQDEKIRKQLLYKLNAGAYRARITRLEALKESIYIHCKEIADTELYESNLGYINTANTAYYKNMYDIQKGTGLAFNFAIMPVDTIEEILKNNWSGKHYSERIWRNSDVLAEKLEQVLTSGMMQGKSSRRMAKELQDMTDYGKYAAERLIRTETTYIANEAEQRSYEECEIDKYVFLATLDLRTSQVCREHDGEVYKVSERKIGVNSPPLHVFCRSTTIAYFGDEALGNMKRRARDPQTGKTYVMDKNMAYKEWYQEHVVNKYGEQKAESFEKMIRNKASDKGQHAKYKGVLGKEVPGTFADFQELKYNDVKKWEELKKKYKLFNKTSSLQERFDYTTAGKNEFIPSRTIINSVKIIAGNGAETELRVRTKLSSKYGGNESDWSKKVGKIESAKYIFDMHWYELDGKQFEMKIKHRGEK